MIDPIFEYAHNTQIPGTSSPATCNAITGGDFVPNGLWAGFDGAYMLGELGCHSIFRLAPTCDGWAASDFASNLGPVVHLRFGPGPAGSQALYYGTFLFGGEVHRITGPAPLATPSEYHTVTPCRLADTRQPPGPAGGPPLAGGEVRSFAVAGVCGVPVGAVAVAINLTATSPTASGFLTVFPACTGRPDTSTINFAAGQTRAGNAVVRLGTAGDLAVFTGMQEGSATDLIVDVVGYFE